MPATRKFPPLLAVVLFLPVACAGGDTDQDTGGAATTDADAYTVPADSAAVITGVVRFEGTAPAPEPIDMSEEPTCAEKHPDGPAFQRVAVNDDGTLRNVFVYVRDGLGERQFGSATEQKVIDQVGCMYQPHVTGLQTGQPLVFRNSDGLLHNVNAQPEANRPFNISQPTSMDSPARTFTQPEIMIPIRCDVHGWMEAYVAVVEHPYFAVTGEDGSFRIENLPPGDYTVEAWHERLGTQTMQVTVAPQQTGETTFTFREGMAGRPVPMGAPIDPHDHGRVATAAAGGAH
ncbi:MAG TPA: carboxypeptidase regulatory-like domain-containing protein [Longimicrobiales bacterium]